MKKELMHEQDNGWKTYYTIPSQYEDFCDFFRHHEFIGKYFPKKDEDFTAQLIFEQSKEEVPGWYLLISNYTKKMTCEFHVYRWSEKHWACCDMRARKHGFFKRWTDWKKL